MFVYWDSYTKLFSNTNNAFFILFVSILWFWDMKNFNKNHPLPFAFSCFELFFFVFSLNLIFLNFKMPRQISAGRFYRSRFFPYSGPSRSLSNPQGSSYSGFCSLCQKSRQSMTSLKIRLPPPSRNVQEVEDFFNNHYGKHIGDIYIPRKKSYAFVRYCEAEDANTAKSRTNGKRFFTFDSNGRMVEEDNFIYVEFAFNSPHRDFPCDR